MVTGSSAACPRSSCWYWRRPQPLDLRDPAGKPQPLGALAQAVRARHDQPVDPGREVDGAADGHAPNARGADQVELPGGEARSSPDDRDSLAAPIGQVAHRLSDHLAARKRDRRRPQELGHAQYPSKVDFYFFDHASSETTHNGTPNWQVTGKADLMNGFGAMIPHEYVCYVSIKGDQLVEFWVVPE
jgi:hypothetical protein